MCFPVLPPRGRGAARGGGGPEAAARVLRQFRQDREFLRREMDLVAIAEDNPAGEIDGDSVCLERLLIGFGSEIEQVVEVAVELRRFGAERGYELLVGGAGSSESADGFGDRLQTGFQI